MPGADQPIGRAARAAFRFGQAGALVVALAGLAALYLDAPVWYFRILRIVSAHPFPHPFIDWEFVPAAVACWRKGVDVYADNPCFFDGGPFMYSPLILRLGFLAALEGATPWCGALLAAALAASLAALPPPRDRLGLAVRIAAALSSATMFAVERGNIDIVIFVAALAGARALASPRLAARLVAYAIFVALGLLKFYPFVLLATAARERGRVRAAVVAAAVACLAAFALGFGGEIVRALSQVRSGGAFGDAFGARNLAEALAGVAGLAGLRPAPAALAAATLMAALLFWLAAVWVAGRLPTGRAAARMTAFERSLAAVAGLVIVFCFFTAQSVGYRAIFLLMALPAFEAVRREAEGPPASWLALGLELGALFLMWRVAIQNLYRRLPLPPGTMRALDVAALVAHEAVWWFVVAVLVAFVLAFLAPDGRAGVLRRSSGRALLPKVFKAAPPPGPGSAGVAAGESGLSAGPPP